eukprot:2550735-Alexandrium_andersonii.AAC.1
MAQSVPASRLDPQSALPNMRNCFRRSELELHGPRHSLNICPRSCRRGAFCTMCRADSEPANENGD